MTREEFFKGIDNRPEGISPLRWVANLGEKKPKEASQWLLAWLRRR